jgi:hypothetical protein
VPLRKVRNLSLRSVERAMTVLKLAERLELTAAGIEVF